MAKQVRRVVAHVSVPMVALGRFAQGRRRLRRRPHRRAALHIHTEGGLTALDGRLDAFRVYSRLIPKGRWVVEYTVRYNNPGTFWLPATRVEALYAPEMLGELPNPSLTVETTR